MGESRGATQQRVGNSMSTKQMARAGAEGRRLEVLLPNGNSFYGYLVGMDDYHWLVLNEVQAPVLVSKGSATVTFHPQTLDSETDSYRERVAEVGGQFMSWCKRFLSKSTPKENS